MVLFLCLFWSKTFHNFFIISCKIRTSESTFFNNVNNILIEHCFYYTDLHNSNSLFYVCLPGYLSS